MNQLPPSNSNSFLGFVPSMVIQHLNHKKSKTTQLPEKQSLKSVVMFADISGFTNLTETLSKRGPEGAEIIAFAINRYMELMVKEIGRSGGDIFKFAGDAMIVVWPPPKQEGQLQNTCRQAVQAALSIQSKLDNMNITDGVKLSVKIGFGVGDFSIIYVGGIFGRAEYLPAGDPLTQAFSAEHAAESGGVINCSQQIYDYIYGHFDIERLQDHDGHQIYQVKKVKEKVMENNSSNIVWDFVKSIEQQYLKVWTKFTVKINNLQFLQTNKNVQRHIYQVKLQQNNRKFDTTNNIPTIISTKLILEPDIILLSVKADAMMIKDSMKTSEIESIKEGVLQYVPRSLQAYIQYEQEQWSSELRLVTIMFMNIGIDLSDCADQEGLKKIQKVIENIQKCVYMYEGSLNKFLMDDKGSTLIVVFGLPPITHQDDAVRAVLCSFAIKNQLKKENCKCSIGIGTGLVFAGVVGTSGNRREYSVIGDSVNLSARIMQKACYEKDDDFKILCSYATMQQAQHKISFKFRESCKFKGKSVYLPIYQPLDVSNEQLIQMDKENKFPLLRTHLFSFPMDAEDKKENMNFFLKIEGYETEQKDATEFVKKFQENKIPKGCLIISGDYGQGKSLLLRKLIYDTSAEMDKKKNQYKFGERPNIIVSNLDPSNKFKKMNIMRSILKTIINIIQKRKYDDGKQGIDIKTFLDNKIFQTDKLKHEETQEDNKIQTKILDKTIQDFKEICGLNEFNYVENFPPKPLPSKTTKDEFKKNHKQEKKDLSLLAMEIFSIYFDQPLEKRKYSGASASSIDSSETYKHLKYKDTKDQVAPLILCLEDLQYADGFSFRVISDILKQFTRVLVIGCMRSTSIEKPSFPPQFLPSQEVINLKGLKKINKKLSKSDPSVSSNYDSEQKSEFYHVIELKGLKMDRIKSIIRVVFNLNSYQYIETKQAKQETGEFQSQNNQAGQNTLNPQKEQNNQHNLQIIKHKIQKYESDNLSSLFFSKIKQDLVYQPEDLFYNFLYLKTQGNPLMAIHFIENLINQRLLIIKDKNIKPRHIELEESMNKNYNYEELIPRVAYLTSHLKKAIMLEDLITIDVPLCKYNINTPVIDKLSCLDLLILKIASVIGDIFDLQTLSKVHPFGNVLKSDKLIEALQNLDQQNVLEVVDQNENNVYYRFCNSFVRETLYQRLIYTQRRQIHLIVAEILQNQVSLPHNQLDDIEKLKYQWLLGENTKDISITDLPHKAKRSIIVKKIQSQLIQSQNNTNTIIKQDYLDKKSDFSKYSWSNRYVVMSTKDIRYYYTSEDSKEKPEDYLGAIPLRFIYEVNMLDPKEYKRKDFPFTLKASMWYKKTKQSSKRDFFFSAKSQEEYEEWYIYLNIAKTKAMQDEFHREYGKVNILKGVSEIDITLKNFLEQKRTQAIQKVEPQRNRRKTLTSSIKSPINRNKEKEQDIKQKRQQEAEDNEILNMNQMKEQENLKKNIEQLIKRGMMLFFNHLFSQALHPDGIEPFGNTSTGVYSKIDFPKITKTQTQNNYRSQTSISGTELTQKASVEFDHNPDLSHLHASQIAQSQQIFHHHINSAVHSNIEPDANGYKKRVTIHNNITSENSSPSHKPKIDSTPIKRKSILTLKPANIPLGIVDSTNFQTPSNQDSNLLIINPNKFNINMIGSSGSNSDRKQDTIDRIIQKQSKEFNQYNINDNKYNIDYNDNSPKGNTSSYNLHTINNNEFIPNSSQTNLNNNEKSRFANKSQLNQKPPLSHVTPQTLGSQMIQSNIRHIEQQPIKEQDEYLNNIDVSPIQSSIQNEPSLSQFYQYQRLQLQQSPLLNPKLDNEFVDTKQNNFERYDGFYNNQQHRRGENISQNEFSPQTPNQNIISPNMPPNSGRQVKNNQSNINDFKRSSTQSTLAFNQNSNVNGNNSFYLSNLLNGNYNQSHQFSMHLADSNNRSVQQSPAINPFQNILSGQNFNILNNEITGRYLNNNNNNNIQQISLNGYQAEQTHQRTNQFDEHNFNQFNQNQYNFSKNFENGMGFTNKKQNESFYEEDKYRGRNTSNSNNNNIGDININKRINSISSGKRPYKYDNLDNQGSNISKPGVGNNFPQDGNLLFFIRNQYSFK